MDTGNLEEKEYREALDYLYGLQRFGIKMGLANITTLLGRLGNPHKTLPAVHIAGSNGKGSTAAFLASILRRAGYRVGLYTSPHLVDFTERIQVDGTPISEEDVVQLTLRIRRAVQDLAREGDLFKNLFPGDFDPQRATITFFEFTTAMAFLHFIEARVDLAVLETGMGGRLDATNVVDPLASLITSISLEHQQYLGKTLLQIAGEKAGIIKPRTPLLTTVHQPKILSLFEEKCKELESPFYAWMRDFRGKRTGPQMMRFEGRRHRWMDLKLGLAGRHQVLNASLALAAAEVLMEKGIRIEEEPLREGLAETRWPGRLELVGAGPKILLDGAHNRGSAKVLRENLARDFPRRELILILGIMADKEIPIIMGSLVPLSHRLILTRPRMDRAASLEVLRSHASRFGKPVAEVPNVGSAVDQALSRAGKEDLIVVSGSLFTVGEARAHLLKKGVIRE